MSPEAFSEKYKAFPNDVWSIGVFSSFNINNYGFYGGILGITAYIITHLKPPFFSNTDNELIRKIKENILLFGDDKGFFFLFYSILI
jgi:serine/threonine protein kinase